tara:strand:- start:192 stop:521 length:330 start_codon:yes stop_codon:yes gene_type:complete
MPNLEVSPLAVVLEQRIPPSSDPWILLLFLVLRLLEKRWLCIPSHRQPRLLETLLEMLHGSDQPPAQSKQEYEHALPKLRLVSHEQDVNHCGWGTTRLLLWQRSLQHWT